MRLLLPLFSLLSVGLFALPTGNPATCQIIDQGVFTDCPHVASGKLGYQEDFVWNQRVRSTKTLGGKVIDFSSHYHQAVMILNLFNLFEVYGSLGSFDGEITSYPQSDHIRRTYDTRSGLNWGVGGRLILFNWKHFTMGVDGKYQHGLADLRALSFDNLFLHNHSKLSINQWQVSTGIAYEVDWFMPYVCLKYSDFKAELRRLPASLLLGAGHATLKGREHIGMSIGCSFSTGKAVELNAEVRLIDEEALTLYGNFQF